MMNGSSLEEIDKLSKPTAMKLEVGWAPHVFSDTFASNFPLLA
jgi:hypothetical protein